MEQDFEELVEIMNQIEELEVRRNELRDKLKRTVEIFGDQIYGQWTAYLRENSVTRRVDYKKLENDYADIYYNLIANSVLTFSEPKEMFSLVVRKIKETK